MYQTNITMRKLTLVIGIFCIALLCGHNVKAQDEGQVLIVGGADIYKTDFNKAFGKAQMGLMANFFIANKVSLGVGYEFYSAGGDYVPVGPRVYPVGKLFLKALPMIPLNRQKFEVNLGLGYDIMISDTWAIELVGDYYPISQQTIAFRMGLAGFF